MKEVLALSTWLPITYQLPDDTVICNEKVDGFKLMASVGHVGLGAVHSLPFPPPDTPSDWLTAVLASIRIPHTHVHGYIIYTTCMNHSYSYIAYIIVQGLA